MKANVNDKVACPVQELSIGWAMQQENPEAAISRVIERSTQWVACQSKNVRQYSAQQLLRARTVAAALLPSLVLFAQATLCVAFAFGLMFISAIIGG